MIQQNILAAIPSSARFLTFALKDGADPVPTLRRLADAPHDPATIVGVGAPVAARVAGLRPFPSNLAPMFPATQHALWATIGHSDRGEQLDASVLLATHLAESFVVVEEVDAFAYRGGRDLSGFEDGTENPKGDAAVEAAFIHGRGAGLDGGSFVAVQRWVHAHDVLASMNARQKSDAVGRDLESNEELKEAATSAHVKRTAQESFEPPAFMVRRSMPWGGVRERGLYFVAYVENLDRFERVLTRMSGKEDGTTDAIMSFTKALTGGYYFCPPLVDGKLDLRALLP
jgi:putative iron-dependent peroxidase